ncbi:MAG: FAD-dependent oxidoreductase [Planctomycetales bacterium]|nr:FAD-dependent oxidoreductase [Planctomycetales bacterium]
MNRSDQLDYDVAIIGGGIHGVGVAQVAAAAGYRAIVIESRALAAGTSCRSSKLIHGGLRYLETLQVGLVRESLTERERLLRIAPSLVRRQPFLIPVYPKTKRRPWQLHLGLTGYWLLAGLKPQTGYRQIPRDQWETLDGLTTRELTHVFQYWDAQTDDRLLTEAVMRSAQSLGAELVCPAEFQQATLIEQGVELQIQHGDTQRTITARTLVNAGGPWATQVAQQISPQPPTPSVDLVAGTHLELPGKVEHGCYYVEAPQDGRAVFVMPWYDRTLLGTTERVQRDDPSNVPATDAEVEYLLAVYRHYFPGRSTQVLDRWAGLRVLPAATGAAFKRSRETQLPTDNDAQPRVLSIFGGKLTGYRATAEKVLAKLRPSLPTATPRGDTRTLPLE